jgi:hypothetical protein
VFGGEVYGVYSVRLEYFGYTIVYGTNKTFSKVDENGI